MKLFLALVGGFVASLGMFVFGLVFATSLLTAEPVHDAAPSVDVAGLWTEEPRRVDTASQDLERLPALPSPSGPEDPEAPDMEARTSLPPGQGETIVSDDAADDRRLGHALALRQRQRDVIVCKIAEMSGRVMRARRALHRAQHARIRDAGLAQLQDETHEARGIAHPGAFGGAPPSTPLRL